MSTSIGGRKIDRSTVQEIGGLELSDLSKASSNVNAMDKGTRLERSILQVPLSTIVGESPMQPRVTTFDPDVYEEDAELLNSIKKFGVLEPIMICRESDSGEKRVYNIVFGHRRMAAALMAGHKTIPAIVAKSGDNVHLLTLAENTGGRSLTAYERAVGLIRWKESNAGITQVKLAKDTGVSQGTISNLLAAYEASTPALRGLFASGMAGGTGRAAGWCNQKGSPVHKRASRSRHQSRNRCRHNRYKSRKCNRGKFDQDVSGG
jgi:ParB/RepB/Spo0J family partition protein